jgi:hypothetical protein
MPPDALRATGDPMHTIQVFPLLLALSGALNVAFTAGLTGRLAGAGPAQAILTAAGAADTNSAGRPPRGCAGWPGPTWRRSRSGSPKGGAGGTPRGSCHRLGSTGNAVSVRPSG